MWCVYVWMPIERENKWFMDKDGREIIFPLWSFEFSDTDYLFNKVIEFRV